MSGTPAPCRVPGISDGFRRLGDQDQGSEVPAHKDLEEFSCDYQPSADRNPIAHPGTGVSLSSAKDVVPGPPGTGKTGLAVGIGIKTAKAGHGVPFNSGVGRVAGCSRPIPARKLPRTGQTTPLQPPASPRLNCIPFDQDAADLFFQLVSRRYEHAR